MQQFTTEKQTQTLEDILIKEKRWEKINISLMICQEVYKLKSKHMINNLNTQA